MDILLVFCSHPLIKKLNSLQTNNPDLGRLVLEQVTQGYLS